MGKRLVIRDGLVIDPEAAVESVQDVLVENGRIAAVGPKLARRHPNCPSLDARGCWILPGLIDLHTHLRQPGDEQAETIASGTRAAAAGGFTTVLAMPNTRPAMDSAARLRRVRLKARQNARINVLFSGCATIGRQGSRLADLKAMAALAAAFTEDGGSLADSDLMRRTLEQLRRLKRPFISHCEDLSLSRSAPVNLGGASRRLKLPGQSWLAETLMVLRDIALARETGANVHIAHVSCRQSVAALRQAKADLVPVTAEATPHHLALCEDDVRVPDPNFKMNPPLRSRQDRDELRRALREGVIDAVATDHAPHTASSKSRGMSRAPFGVIGLETALAVVMTELYHKGWLSRRDVARRLSAAPARILGLTRKGTLKPGSDADVTVVAPDETWIVPARFHSLSRNSPFVGRKLRGRARACIAGGEPVHVL
jgi:dihydroorotase